MTTSPRWGADERGKAGLFLAFQYPQTIPGVSVLNFLRQALSARKGIDLSMLELRLSIMEWMAAPRHGSRPSPTATSTRASPAARRSATRSSRWPSWNPSWPSSTRPTPASTSMRSAWWPSGIREVQTDRPDLGLLVVTHYQRLLEEIVPVARPPHHRRPDRRVGRHGAGHPPGGRGLRGLASDPGRAMTPAAATEAPADTAGGVAWMQAPTSHCCGRTAERPTHRTTSTRPPRRRSRRWSSTP